MEVLGHQDKGLTKVMYFDALYILQMEKPILKKIPTLSQINKFGLCTSL